MTAEWVTIGVGDWGLYQDPRGLTYGTDAVLLAAFALGAKPGPILDMGTGTGIIAFLLAHAFPDRPILGVDIQDDLVTWALASRDRNDIPSDRLCFECQDLRQPPKNYGNRFTTVLCNPPYFKAQSGQLNSHPARAIARHAGFFSSPEVFRAAAYALRQGGRFYLIQRTENIEAVFQAARDHKIKASRVQMVHSKAGQAAKLFLYEGIYEGSQDPTILPPLVLYDDDGQPGHDLLTAYKGVCDYAPADG